MSLAVLGIEVASLVYFCADPSITRNLFGRRGWLDRIRFGLVDRLIMTVPHIWTRTTADPEQLTARKTEHLVAYATSIRGLRAPFQSYMLESCDRAASQLLCNSDNLRIAAARAPVRLRDASPARIAFWCILTTARCEAIWSGSGDSRGRLRMRRAIMTRF